jgi:mono/diheme cytochrome c family protein
MKTTKTTKTMKTIGLALGLAMIAAPASGQEVAMRSAAWGTYCAVCHGPDGRANTEEGKKKGARDLSDPRWQAAVSDARLEGSVRRGRDKMPAFGKKLTEEQVKALVAEVRGLAAK